MTEITTTTNGASEEIAAADASLRLIEQQRREIDRLRQQAQEAINRATAAEGDLRTTAAALHQAESDLAALLAAADRVVSSTRPLPGYDDRVALVLRSALAELTATATAEHPGRTLLAVADAARAYLDADDYADLASPLLALRSAVETWKRGTETPADIDSSRLGDIFDDYGPIGPRRRED